MSMARSTEISGFLDGREYTASFLYEFCALIVGNGVYANELTPTANNDNMTVTYGSGHGWINGVLYKNTTPFDMEFDTADGALNRYDSIMLRLDLSRNEAYAVVEKGAFASAPIPPDVTRNAETFDLKICDVYIPAGCTKITQAQIIDRRLDSSVCGVPVFPIEHLDMTTFYRQVATDLDNLKKKEQAEILALLEQLNDLVAGDTVGKLIAQINTKLAIDGTTGMTADLPMDGHRVKNMGEPKESSDAVNLGYVQNNTAPAGFGLGQMGGALKDVTDFSQLDAIVRNGWYFIRFPEPFYIDGAFAQFFCLEVCGETNEHIHQTIHLIGSNYKLHRWCDMGVWGVVEWENPPMVPGVEYRTTERHNGRVVYAMAVSCGTMTDGTEIIFKTGANPIRYSGTADGAALPFMSSEPYSMWVRLHTGTITFHCGAGRGSADNVMVQVWYTKD